MTFFTKENRTAFEAIEYAQWIAYAPMVFQASRILRDSGILLAVENSGTSGITIDEIVLKVQWPAYSVRVLLESGLGIGLVIVNDEKYTLTKTGHFILNDKMTNVNMNFTNDVCYQGLFDLEESLKSQKPIGLKVLGDWETIYEGLSILPEKAKKSWFEFDHFYSDDVFPTVLPLVFKYKPKKIMDIGGNTGKWAMHCAKFDADVSVTIVDLPGQVNLAKKNIEKENLSNRISFHETNMLDVNQELPKGHDTIWMSQFLDCFSDNEITSILTKCHNAITDDGVVYILEPFWDCQRFESAAFSLQQTSLYFTAMANGNSQMYHSEVFKKCIDLANLEIVEQTDRIGACQTLLKCRKKK